MQVTLDDEEVETLLTSLDYSKQRVREAQETPYDVRKQNLARLEAVEDKLREARRQR